MKHAEIRNSGLQWTLTSQLHDLDYADDIVLISETLNHLQAKTNRVCEEAAMMGLTINIDKTKTMRVNSGCNTEVTVNGTGLEDVDKFTYLGSLVNKSGGAEEDAEARIRKARQAFMALFKIWKSRLITRKTKLRLFNSNVKSVLLYGSETWHMTEAIRKKLQTFLNHCLRIILKVFWPAWITNEDLWKEAEQKPIDHTIRERKWKWIGHTMRKEPSNITRQALRWNPAGKRSRGRPRQTWRRTVEKEMKIAGMSWGVLPLAAGNRVRWRADVTAICAANASMQ